VKYIYFIDSKENKLKKQSAKKQLEMIIKKNGGYSECARALGTTRQRLYALVNSNTDFEIFDGVIYTKIIDLRQAIKNIE